MKQSNGDASLVLVLMLLFQHFVFFYKCLNFDFW